MRALCGRSAGAVRAWCGRRTSATWYCVSPCAEIHSESPFLSFCGGKTMGELKAEEYCVKEKHCAGVRFTAQGETQTCEWQTGVC